MRCKFVVDVGVDVSTMAQADKALIRWRQVRNAAGAERMEPYFPAGTEYDTPSAAFFVNRGMAIPADAECERACEHLSPEQRQKLMLSYQADEAGVTDPNDRELFFAGVISGYEQVNGRTAYRPGPNYAGWKAAQDQIKRTRQPSDGEVPI